MEIVVVAIILLPIILMGLVLMGTLTKGKWGINIGALFKFPKCPKCGEKLPSIRVPKDENEMRWGGWTCSKCGAKINKWGKLLKDS